MFRLFLFFFSFDMLSTKVPERCQKLHYNAVSFKCLSESSELCIYFILLCVNSVFITGFGSLLFSQNLPDFIITVVYLSVLILQLALLVSEFLVSRYLASNFFVIWCSQHVTYMKTTIGGKDTVQYDTTEKYQTSNRKFWTVS